MGFDWLYFAPVLAAVAVLAGIFWLLRRIDRKSIKVPAAVELWYARDYRCPECGSAMEQGWTLLGKGAIWSARNSARPGTFSSINSALDNTISLSLPPASNMAWRCRECKLLLVDHSKLVGK